MSKVNEQVNSLHVCLYSIGCREYIT